MSDTRTSLDSVVSIVYITPENGVFEAKNQFLTLAFTHRGEDGVEETKHYDRVFLHRSFPYDRPEAYISVQDSDKNEIGMIADIAQFPEDTAALLRGELNRKYYAPILRAIHSVRDKYGYAYIHATTDTGDVHITLRDASRSMARVDAKRVIITDIDGNRYDIPDVTALDKKSFRRIELYL